MKRTTCSLIIAAALSTASLGAYAGQNDWSDTAKDAWIDGKAESTLMFNGNLNSFDINTDVKNGVVTLTGKVENDVDKALAEELVMSLDGVSEVNNELTVMMDHDEEKSEIVSEMTDAKVATVVKTRLIFESEVSASDINVEVEEGVVTLIGEVDNDAERDLAVTIAKNTSDVKNVVDKLAIGKKVVKNH